MKVYGSNVVGKEAAAAALAGQKKARLYGDKVLGSAVDQSEEAQKKRDALPGPGQGNKLPPDTSLDALVAKYATNDGYLSISDVKNVLADMPEAFDRLVGWELGRDDGPRIGALGHFIEIETARSGGARPTILKNLETALSAVRSKGKG